MSWIQKIDHQTRDMPNVFRAISLDPEALQAVGRLNEALAFGGSSLSRVQEEAIATVVAVANRCRYDAMIHGGFLRRYCGNSELPGQLLHDYTQANLDPADLRMLDFAVKLTQDPSSLTRDDLEGLREAGFDEELVLSIVLTTCLFNFMNRLASALGVDVPPGYQKGMETWLAGPAVQQGWLMQSVAEQARRRLDRPAEGEHDAPEAAGAEEPEDRTAAPEPDALSLARFVSDCCRVGPGASESARNLYIAYLMWCNDRGKHPLAQGDFSAGLAELGLESRRNEGGSQWWQGVALEVNGTGESPEDEL